MGVLQPHGAFSDRLLPSQDCSDDTTDRFPADAQFQVCPFINASTSSQLQFPSSISRINYQQRSRTASNDNEPPSPPVPGGDSGPHLPRAMHALSGDKHASHPSAFRPERTDRDSPPPPCPRVTLTHLKKTLWHCEPIYVSISAPSGRRLRQSGIPRSHCHYLGITFVGQLSKGAV